MASVLACGDDSALSHRAATGAYALRPAWRDWLEVSTTKEVHVSGVITHRVRTMEVTTLRGIPITTVARTLVDLADVTSPRILQQVIDQAEILRLDGRVEVVNGRRGAGRLKHALARLDPLPHVPRSELERRFLDLCPTKPVMGLVVEGYETDFAWPDRRVIAEVDGWETHRTKTAFQADRRRDTAMAAKGWIVLRFTYRDVVHDPAHVTSTLARLLV
jgi:hypothetical protein